MMQQRTAANASDQTLSGLQGGETLTLGGSGTVASANVGTGKAITLGSLSLSNGTGTASNYTLTGGTHTFYNYTTNIIILWK